MANKNRMIDAMGTVTKISKRVTPLIAQGCHPQRVYAEILKVIAEQPTVDAVEVAEHIELREQYDKLFLEYHELRDNFISYVCGGVPNPSPFCLNKRKGCCDCYGWCKNDDKCKGFNPAEVIMDGAKMDGDGNG